MNFFMLEKILAGKTDSLTHRKQIDRRLFRISDFGLMNLPRKSRIAPSFYRSIVLSFHRSIVPSLHRSIVPSLHRSIVPSFHRRTRQAHERKNKQGILRFSNRIINIEILDSTIFFTFAAERWQSGRLRRS